MNAGLELIEQGNGYVVVRANDIKPTVDLPVYLTYGANITIVPSPEYVGEANTHVDTVAYASRWTAVPDGWEQEVDVEGITSNSIGSMGLRNGCTELQAYNAAVARIKITRVYDNKVLLTATKIRPAVNIPLSFVFGRNFNLVKYPGVIGKVAFDTNYIVFDDTLINSGVSTVQQLLEYFQRVKVNKADISDRVHDGALVTGFETKQYIPEETDTDWSLAGAEYIPLSARMGRYLFLRKINYDDIIDNLTSTNKDMPLSANMGKTLNDDLQAHKNTTTIHVPTVNGGNGKYLMYNNAVEGNKEWHTLNVDGVNAGTNGDMIHYSTCSTAAGTAAKTVSATGFTLITGARLSIKFTVTNTATNPTLNINSTGARSIYYKGAAIAAEKLVANRIYTFVYDGTNYVLIGDISTYTPVTTTKAYVTGTTSSTTTTVPDQIFDPEVYLDTVSGRLHANSFHAGSGGIINDGNFTNTGNLNITGNLDVDGTTSTDGITNTGNITNSGNITNGGTLTNTGNVDFNGNLDVDGTTNTDGITNDGALVNNGDVDINGNLSVSGNLDIDGTTNTDGINNTGNITNSGNITNTGNVNITGNLDVDGTTNTDGISNTGDITSTGDINIDGYISASNISSDIIIKVQSSQPAAVSGKNVIWIKV